MGRIVVYNPIVLLGNEKSTEFHGYAVEFIRRYADYIYIANPRILFAVKKKIQELAPDREIKITMSVGECSKKCDIMAGFSMWSYEKRLRHFSGLKVFHTMDYYLDVETNIKFLRDNKIDYVIGHTQLDKHCPFFQEYYPEWAGRVIALPFGYHKKYKVIKGFEERVNKAVGLGSINPINDPLCSTKQKKEFVKYFSNKEYAHELRRYVQQNKEEFEEVIDARFPQNGMQKDFSYDAVEMLNSYTMFLNDEGVSNFPPARTFEGIACGAVMVASDSDIYKELGFLPGYNYIAFQKDDYDDLKSKIKYYMDHVSELKSIQEHSLKLAEKFSHEKISEYLYKTLQEKIKV